MAETFREDLFYRLNVVSIEIPPLRFRPADIPVLAMHFLRTYAAAEGKNVTGLSDEALERIIHHSWPGNVRELENAIERAVVVCRGEEIQESDLAPQVLAGAAATREGLPPVPGATLAELERHAIIKTLEHTGAPHHERQRCSGSRPARSSTGCTSTPARAVGAATRPATTTRRRTHSPSRRRRSGMAGRHAAHVGGP